MPTVSHTALEALVDATFRAAGSDPAEAAAIAAQLIGANLVGHDSHGVGLVPPYIDMVRDGLVSQNRHVEVVSDAGALLVLDGRMGFGAVIGAEAMDLGIGAAERHGAAVVSVRNSFHLGRIGHWAERCARRGMASIHFVNVAGHPPLVAPFGSREGRFATNPVCIAIPGGEDGTPLAMLDMATSTIALGKARVALNKGIDAPQGSIIDADGNPTNDPAVMFSEPMGALVAMGEHKGSGLAVMAELLGALTGGVTMQPDNPRSGTVINNMLTIVIDPDSVGGSTFLQAEATAFLDYVKDSRPLDGVAEVLIPGEPEKRRRADRLANGIDVSDGAWELIVEAARSVGTDQASIDACR